MSELPKGWVSSSLSGVIPHNGIISDGDWVESKDQDPEGIVRLIQLADIGDGDFKNKSQRFMTEDAAERLNCSYLKSGDLLIARMPDPLGRACIFPGVGQKAVTVVDVCFIRENELSAISNSLLKYWINSPKIRNLIASNSSGSTRKRITRKNLERFIFPVPPQAEQTRIVEKLDEVLAQVDTIKARLDGIPAILKRFRQSVLAAAVSGRLTEEWRSHNPVTDPFITWGVQKEVDRPFIFPDTWRGVRLGSVSHKVSVGHVGKTSEFYTDESNGIPFLRSQNVRPGFVSTSGLAYIKKDFHDSLKKSQLQPGDLLVVRVGANRGDSCVLPDMFTAVNCANIVFARPMKELSEYLNIYFQSPSIQKLLLDQTVGGAQGVINTKSVQETFLALPPIEEQKEIVRLVDQYFAFADTIAAQVKKAQTRVDNLTQSILAKAFRGELVAQDPDDEPAEKLLERIAQARKEAEALAKAAKKVAKTK